MKHFVTLPYLLSMYSTSSGRGFLPLVTAAHEISPTCSCMRNPGEGRGVYDTHPCESLIPIKTAFDVFVQSNCFTLWKSMFSNVDFFLVLKLYTKILSRCINWSGVDDTLESITAPVVYIKRIRKYWLHAICCWIITLNTIILLKIHARLNIKLEYLLLFNHKIYSPQMKLGGRCSSCCLWT